tara:strand:- start:847 stop:981 length:135 start_codon:yes stop_codon:yes gene_type:complete
MPIMAFGALNAVLSGNGCTTLSTSTIEALENYPSFFALTNTYSK